MQFKLFTLALAILSGAAFAKEAAVAENATANSIHLDRGSSLSKFSQQNDSS